VGIIQNKAYYIELSIILNLILHYKLRKKKNLVDIKNVISYSFMQVFFFLVITYESFIERLFELLSKQ
jgi:hypothetical protein